MPILRDLDEEEAKIFIHLVKNKGRSVDQSIQATNDLIDDACDNSMAEKLAKLSEDSNYAMKNRYKHDFETMNYARKDKMPIDQSKVKDLLRNQHIFRHKINSDIPTYSQFHEKNKGWENGILSYLLYGADSGMREMITDLGISWQTNRYESQLGQDVKRMDTGLHESDKHLNNFMNARFIAIDMTEYIYDFPSPNEIGHIPFGNLEELEKNY